MAQGTGHRAQGAGHRAQGTGHRAQGTGHRAQGTGHTYLWSRDIKGSETKNKKKDSSATKEEKRESCK